MNATKSIVLPVNTSKLPFNADAIANGMIAPDAKNIAINNQSTFSIFVDLTFLNTNNKTIIKAANIIAITANTVNELPNLLAITLLP